MIYSAIKTYNIMNILKKIAAYTAQRDPGHMSIDLFVIG